jgi:phage gp29-like protein
MNKEQLINEHITILVRELNHKKRVAKNLKSSVSSARNVYKNEVQAKQLEEMANEALEEIKPITSLIKDLKELRKNA